MKSKFLAWLQTPVLSNFAADSPDSTAIRPRHIVARIAISLLVVTWFASLPGYLFIFYMLENEIFAYDFFVDALYAQGIFVIAAVLFFAAVSFLLYGSVIWLKVGLVERRENRSVSITTRIYFYLFLSLFAVFHYAIIVSAFKTESPFAIVPALILCLALTLFISTYIGRRLTDTLVDWKTPALLVLLTVFVPLVTTDLTAEFVALGLRMFKVGGGGGVIVHRKSGATEDAVTEGQLILLGPGTVYIRTDSNSVMVVPVTDNTVIEVQGKTGSDWTSPGTVDSAKPHCEAPSNASGLTSPR